MSHRLRDAAVVFSITFALFAGLEMAARLWYAIRAPAAPIVVETNNPKPPEDLNRKYDTEDLNDFTADSRHAPRTFAWHPYVYWRRRAHDFPSIHVDANGIRRTVQPFDASAKTKIFMFGGSTMWGTGVRDEHTIPSLLAKKLSEAGYRDFYVTNFGESAYVITQELLSLMLELRRGNVPQIAIFYDGINEVASSHINKVPGKTQHETEIGFYESAPKKVEQMSSIEVLAMCSALVKAATNIQIKLGLRPKPVDREPAFQREESLSPEKLAQATVSTYWGVVREIEALAQAYHFEAYFFWQPSIFSKATRSKQEDEIVKGEGNDKYWDGYAPLLALVNTGIRNTPAKPPHFADLQSAFDGDTRNLFIDIFHLTEKGNSKIADLMIHTLARDSRTLQAVQN